LLEYYVIMALMSTEMYRRGWGSPVIIHHKWRKGLTKSGHDNSMMGQGKGACRQGDEVTTRGINGRVMKRVMSRKRAIEIIENFGRPKLLVVGDIMVDHFIWGQVSRISPEAPVPVVEVHEENLLLGGSANVVNNIFALEGRVSLAGVLGSDDMGDRLIGEFRARDIDIRGIVRETNRPTTVKTRVVAQGQQVVRFDRESAEPVRQDSISRMLAYIGMIREQLDAVIISDYSKGVVTKPLLDGIRELVAGRNIVVCVDPKQDDFSLYRSFDVITPNHHEAQRALGILDNSGNKVLRHIKGLKVVEALFNRYDFRALLITKGEEGMSLYERNGGITHTRFPAEAREVFDVTGAGDTVIGVFTLAFAAGASFKEAAVLANHAAGIVVGKIGTATVSRKELKRVI
jgi:D-beta-D-heptose 7-phosphate kinase/D-beta-D-heptose 1-phosphate adenosyltransferase